MTRREQHGFTDEFLESERGGWGFPEEVRRSFAFLESEYGFVLATSRITLVRYTSDVTFVRVFHARMGFDVGAEIGLLTEGEPQGACDIAEIMAVQGAGDRIPETTVASSADAMRQMVSLVAGLVREFGGPALRAEPWIYSAVHKRRVVLTRRFTIEGQRADAADAFARGNLREAIKLWERMGSNLNRDERKLLRRAWERLSSGES